jgi:hypothetical protein
MVSLKKCSSTFCGQVNPQNLCNFSKDKTTKDGFQRFCKNCRKSHNILKKQEISNNKKAYYLENKTKITEDIKRYRKKFPEKINARSALQRSNKAQRTPKWLNKKHYKEINDFYDLAKDLEWLSEEKLHVDHIVPLRGKDVCGLHVPWNLQILPEVQNISKGNRFK